jgi:hypothetical protein
MTYDFKLKPKKSQVHIIEMHLEACRKVITTHFETGRIRKCFWRRSVRVNASTTLRVNPWEGQNRLFIMAIAKHQFFPIIAPKD